jgi:hypothetical protein
MGWGKARQWARLAERQAGRTPSPCTEVATTLANLVKAARRTEVEDEMAFNLRGAKVPTPVREWAFAAAIGRAWRFDYAWPAVLVALEIQGGGWLTPDDDGNRRGAHGGGAALERDCEKYSGAAILGWRVLQVTPSQVRSGVALVWIEEALASVGLLQADRVHVRQATRGSRP